MSSNLPVIHFVNFNQIGSCISIATSQGFKIYNCDPFGKFYSQKRLTLGQPTSNERIVAGVDGDEGDSYAIVEMLFSTSLLAVVGLGDQPALSPRRLTMVNTKSDTIICEVTFPTTILSVKMNKLRLVVLLKEQIYIYDISNMRLLHTIETNSNKLGIITLSSNSNNEYLAYPSPPKIINSDIKSNLTTNNITISSSVGGKLKTGSLGDDGVTGIQKVKTTNDNDDDDNDDNEPNENETINTNEDSKNDNNTSTVNSNNIVKNGDVILFDLKSLQPTMVIEAHKGSIAALALSNDGSLLATASEKGTIIRVFSVETGGKLYQFRRGTYPTTIFSISFSKNNEFLSVTCSSKTVHIFKMSTIQEEEDHITDENSLHDDEASPDQNGDDISSINSQDMPKTRDPYVDTSRSTVGRMIRKSSQQISRQAAKKWGQIFPNKVKAMLESSRHYASFKLPVDSHAVDGNVTNNNTTNIKSIATIGEQMEIDTTEYPELYGHRQEAEHSATVQPLDSLASSSSSTTPRLIRVFPVRVVSSDGNYYNFILDPERGGDCLLLSQYSILSD